MIPAIAKCGCDCVHCPTYKKNLSTMDDRRRCSSGWEKYLKLKLSPEKLRACDGCSIPDRERRTYYLNCKVRRCAMVNNMDHCAYCNGFPCNELLKAHRLQTILSREEYTRKTKRDIPEKDYALFIEPYAGIHHLGKLRQSLSDEDLRDYKRFSTRVRFVTRNHFTGKHDSLMKIYLLLTTVCIGRDVSYARLQTLENRREHLMKLLWAMGLYGTCNTVTGYTEMDGKTFLSRKITGMYSALLGYADELGKHDVHCEIVPLKEKGWLTPTGGLRKEGWIFRLKFGESLNGNKTLMTFMEYIRRLDKTFGHKAFRVFKSADLKVMTR